jgi:dephospho-CoA kinase
MKVIGLTGNIGCGKSTVAGMLRDLGAVHIDADRVARDIRRNDADARAAILARFGTEDAAELGGIVFADADALAELAEAGERVVVVEVVKLLESPLADACDEVWVVRCDEADAIARLAVTRGMDEASARRRMEHQSPQEDKVAAADVVIDGSAPIEETRRQVERSLTTLLAAS